MLSPAPQRYSKADQEADAASSHRPALRRTRSGPCQRAMRPALSPFCAQMLLGRRPAARVDVDMPPRVPLRARLPCSLHVLLLCLMACDCLPFACGVLALESWPADARACVSLDAGHARELAGMPSTEALPVTGRRWAAPQRSRQQEKKKGLPVSTLPHPTALGGLLHCPGPLAMRDGAASRLSRRLWDFGHSARVCGA